MSEKAANPFARNVVIAGIAISLIAGLLAFVLNSYAPQKMSEQGVTASPTSNSAVGYSGFVRLLREAGPETRVLTRKMDLRQKGLLIVFVDAQDNPEALQEIAEIRADAEEPVLFVLPKWAVAPMGLSQKRVGAVGTFPPDALESLLEPIAPGKIAETQGGARTDLFGVTVTLPDKLHVARGDADTEDGLPEGAARGLIVPGKHERDYVLTDPDMMNNAGIDDLANARAMFALVDHLRYTGDPVLIATPRLSTAGARNLGKLLFDPPFLPLTLILLFAGLLALIHGFNRFGPVVKRARVFALGKRALVETSADLLRRAGRIGGLGPRYAAMMRARAGERLGAPPSLSGDRLAEWIDARTGQRGEERAFSTRADAVANAQNEEELHARARALAHWIEGQR